MTWDMTCEKWAEMVIRVKPREPESPPPPPPESPAQSPAQSPTK